MFKILDDPCFTIIRTALLLAVLIYLFFVIRNKQEESSIAGSYRFSSVFLSYMIFSSLKQLVDSKDTASSNINLIFIVGYILLLNMCFFDVFKKVKKLEKKCKENGDSSHT